MSMNTKTDTFYSAFETVSSNFSSLPNDDFILNDDGTITWKPSKDTSFVIAQLEKSEAFYAPSILLTQITDLNKEQVSTIEKKLNQWLTETIKKTLEFLFMLENTPIQGIGKGIAFQLFEENGIIYRPRIQNLIKPLELSDRQALSRLGIRIGAHYVYVKDCLKPASISLMSILWRTFNPQTKEAITPPAGNVSFAVPENAPKRFYLTIGFPIFGDLAIRADMIERLNSAIFEKAVEGNYTFDPALASTIGASVEQTHKVLKDLGFPSHEEVIKEPEDKKEDTAKDKAEETKETANKTTEEAEKEAPKQVIYSLKRVRPHYSDKKPNPVNKSASDKKNKTPKKKPIKKKISSVVQDKSHGHNAFAGLDMLLKQQDKK